MLYFELFIVYFQIGLFSFGGGYAAMPLIQSLIVEQRAWLSVSEFADLSTIAEMTPGPISINSATFVGQKMAGFTGALICTLGCVLPSFIIVLLFASLYVKYRELKAVKTILQQLRPAIISLIASAACTIVLLAFFGTSQWSEIQVFQLRYIEVILFIISLFLLRKYHCHPILVITMSAVFGTILYQFY